MGVGKGIVSYPHLGANGRLGNCLFQVATTVAYALDHDKNYLFPEWSHSKFLRTPLPEGVLDGPRTGFTEPSFSFSPIPAISGNVELLGYYQSWRYFDHHREPILKLFELRPDIEAYVQHESLILMKRRDRMCSIHVRRGDYLSNPETNAYHGIPPIEYYMDAVEHLYGTNSKKVLFHIFSDDPQYCKDSFGFLHNTVFSEGQQDIVDMYLMACCQDHIIANSSFSYWGSYLSQYKDKRIVAPKRWFTGANAPQDTKDLYLPKTIIL